MITKLTKEQEKGIIDWRNHCLEIGYDTSSINKEVVENSWTKFYKILGYKKPTFWYCQSPLQAQIIINIFPEIEKIIKQTKGENIRNNIGNNIEKNIESNIVNNIGRNIESNIESNIWKNIRNNIVNNIGRNIGRNIVNNIVSNIWRNIGSDIWRNIGSNIWRNIGSNIRKLNFECISTYSWCQHDISWIGYYKYYEKYGLLPYDKNFEIFNIWHDLACSCGWCYTFENIIFICEKPCEIHINENKQLHKNGDMALKYSDGYGLYMLNGVNVSKYLAITPESNLDIEFFKKEKNADIKAEFVRKYGIDRMESFGKTIDSYKKYPNEEWWQKSQYTLIDMSKLFSSINYAPFLKMKNLTTETFHLEGVDPSCKTIKDALKFRWNNRQLENFNIETIK